MSIVQDLQKLAIDSNCDILTLLRKAYYVARKLGIVEFQEWITYELNGYDKPNIIPDYRKIKGSLKGYNIYRGWVSVIIQDKELEDVICTHNSFNSIPSLINLISNQSLNTLSVQLPGEIIQQISSMTGQDTDYILQISSNSIANIIEQVKNKILEWSLLLEENGIVGVDLQFTENEKIIVQTSPQIINYVSNFYGNIEHSKIQQGTNESTIE